MFSREEKKRFQIAICGCWQAFNPTGKDLPIETQRAYVLALQDLGIEKCERGIFLAMQRCKWFPKPAEIRELVEDPIESVEYRAGLAWQLALKNAVTNRRPIDFDDKLINAVIRRLGGLDYFATLGTSEANRFVRPRFIEEYRLMDRSDYGIVPSQLAPLRCTATRSDQPLKIACDSMSTETKSIPFSDWSGKDSNPIEDVRGAIKRIENNVGRKL